MDLFNRILNRDDKTMQLKNEVKSLQLRKESITSTLDNEIHQLLDDKHKVLFNAGSKAYEDWTQGNENINNLHTFWEEISKIETEIAEKESKKMEIKARYDEEISFLQRDISNGLTNEDGLVCQKCGTVNKQGYLFCEKCGCKLQ